MMFIHTLFYKVGNSRANHVILSIQRTIEYVMLSSVTPIGSKMHPFHTHCYYKNLGIWFHIVEVTALD